MSDGRLPACGEPVYDVSHHCWKNWSSLSMQACDLFGMYFL